jgi:predicted nucleic acid-binding protein
VATQGPTWSPGWVPEWEERDDEIVVRRAGKHTSSEVHAALFAGHSPKPRAPTAATGLLLDHQSLTLQDADIVKSALDHFRARPSLGFSDCLVLEIARKAGHLPLGTFDKALARLNGAHAL